MTLTVRSATVTGATTKGSPLTHAELDENFNHLSQAANISVTQSGSGAVAETVQSALRDLRAGISTDTAYSRFYRYDATFNGTVDHGTFLGYNTELFGQIKDAAKSSILIGMEPDYNDGSTRVLEYHVNMAVPGGSYKRPYLAVMAITGGDAGDITENNITSDENISLLSRHTKVQAAATFTVGAQFHLISLDTGGQDWELISTGTGAAVGAGHLLVFNNTDTRYSALFLGGESSLSIAATGAGLIDTDNNSSFLQVGNGGSGGDERTNIRWRNGGFAAVSNANAASNGDKLVWWNASGVKVAGGIDSNGAMFFQNHRPSGSAGAASFRWYGGLAAGVVELMRLDGSGNFFTRSTGTEIATDATEGFAHIPTCNGTPTGTPGTLLTGAAPLVIDRANNKLYFYSGGAWRDAGP